MNCPVQIPCADHALKVREPYGVWGGMTEEEREEHHARQKALARAQAARQKEARARQEKLKEKLLREKAMQNQVQAKEPATANDAATYEPATRRKRAVGGSAAAAAPKTKAADTNAPKKAPSKPAARKKTKPLVKA